MGQQILEQAVRQAEQLLQQGRDREAAEAARQLAARMPADPRPDYLLGMALARRAATQPAARQESAAAFRRVLARAPDHPGTLLHLGLLLAEGGDAGAEALLDRFLAGQPNHVRALVARANLRQQLGRAEAALPDYARALGLQPQQKSARSNFAMALLKAGQPARALQEVRQVLAMHPCDIRALALAATAAAGSGDLAGWRRLVEHDRFPRAATPFGTDPAALAVLNAALTAEIRGHPTFTREWDETRRAIRGGAVALDLLLEPSPTVRRFEAAIRATVDALIAELPAAPDHPWLARRPRSYDFVMWGNILDGPGHQSPHIHNLGWLSGVYYVAVPPQIAAEDPDRGGWIEFGRPGYGLPEALVDPARYALHLPRPGQALFFPSYYWHGTRPYRGEGERISIAFDVHVTEWA